MSVPMKFPATMLSLVGPSIKKPTPFPLTILRWLAVVPPTWLPCPSAVRVTPA